MATHPPVHGAIMPKSAPESRPNALVEVEQVATREAPTMDLQNLPNELLFNISCRLSSKSLCNLSLVSKHVSEIAQVELHTAPQIKCDSTSFYRIFLLQVTLYKRPDFAAKVYSLEIEVAVNDRIVWDNSETGSYGNSYTIREKDLVGDLLHYAINLQQFKLSMFRDVDASKAKPVDPRAYVHHNIGRLFNVHGRDPDRRSLLRDLSLIPGLKKLTSLSFNSGGMEWAWCALPRLKKLHIGLHCALGENLSRCGPSKIRELSLDRDSGILCALLPHQSQQMHPMYYYLDATPKLVKLILTLCNTRYSKTRDFFYDYVASRNWGSFENLIRHIKPVASTLEHLVIKECSHKCTSVRDYVHPVKSLTDFKRLRVLNVPYEAIFGSHHRPAATILPAKLEHLHLHEPQDTIYPVLENLAAHPEDLPNLEMIDMPLRNSRGIGFEEIKYRKREIWGKLRSRGVVCRFWTYGKEYLKAWDDEEYDPFICEVVEYLESLKPDSFSNDLSGV
ncbi:hypothetical protein IQ06DRAFT_347100 [Phaeosphaeriaceae sp. SRC1lsM3a]|nr:hypothetical protein IQ06DRAFT_347100 [Stagonospora sp. SRC1lsM3a]